jgi:methylthioribose-1-phosphate isomerase
VNLNTTPYTSIWLEPETDRVFYIDQTRLPEKLVVLEMKTFEDGVRAIRDMEVRGAPLIGVAAAFAMAKGIPAKAGMTSERSGSVEAVPAFAGMTSALAKILLETRPTAVNLRYAVEYMLRCMGDHRSLLQAANALRQEELDRCRLIGEHGLNLIREIADRKPGAVVNIMTHCNAGWLATVDYGTALAPIYLAYDQGIDIHVWVSETRPRNQGTKLTAFELSGHGVPCTVVVDNACGHLMQKGEVDLVIVGADRITRNGDAANKIGTYLKALAAFDNQIPFYVAAPSSTFDETMETGDEIPIEERSGDEVRDCKGMVRSGEGMVRDGEVVPVGATCGRPSSGIPENIPVRNPGFDVTPARLISGYITEEGICTL